MRLQLTCLTGRLTPIVMKLKPKPKPVKPMQRSRRGLIGSRPLAMTKLPGLAGVLEVVLALNTKLDAVVIYYERVTAFVFGFARLIAQ